MNNRLALLMIQSGMATIGDKIETMHPPKEDIQIPIRSRTIPDLQVVKLTGAAPHNKPHKPNTGLKIGGYNSNHKQGKARKINRNG